MPRVLNTAVILSAAAFSVAPYHAVAQTTENGPANRSTQLEEVMVTARRREETSQIVPVSVNAFGSVALEERSIRSLGDLTSVAPGIRFVHQGGSGNMNVVLRGLARIPIGTAPNAVINYFADVPLSFQGSNIPTYDLSSIQVLKGPQGTLFGRNAMAGAVVITPQAPTYELEGYVRGGLGNYDYRRDAEGAIDLPLVDNKVALRVAGKTTRRDGYTENMGVGRDQDDIDQEMYRVSLLIEPTESLTNTTIFDHYESENGGTGAVLSACSTRAWCGCHNSPASTIATRQTRSTLCRARGSSPTAISMMRSPGSRAGAYTRQSARSISRPAPSWRALPIVPNGRSAR